MLNSNTGGGLNAYYWIYQRAKPLNFFEILSVPLFCFIIPLYILSLLPNIKVYFMFFLTFTNVKLKFMKINYSFDYKHFFWSNSLKNFILFLIKNMVTICMCELFYKSHKNNLRLLFSSFHCLKIRKTQS